jgi:hypothetical protein
LYLDTAGIAVTAKSWSVCPIAQRVKHAIEQGRARNIDEAGHRGARTLRVLHKVGAA